MRNSLNTSRWRIQILSGSWDGSKNSWRKTWNCSRQRWVMDKVILWWQNLVKMIFDCPLQEGLGDLFSSSTRIVLRKLSKASTMSCLPALKCYHGYWYWNMMYPETFSEVNLTGSTLWVVLPSSLPVILSLTLKKLLFLQLCCNIIVFYYSVVFDAIIHPN